MLATIAAYAFAWMKFPLRDTLFVAIFALQIVPLQVALLPLLEIFVGTGLNDTFWTVWIAHSTFALPLAIFLLHNSMRDIPAELVEAARVDGAGHVRIFTTIMLPLMKPAIAAFAVFQFLWVWNDLLVALVFAGGTADVAPLTVRVAELSGTRGSDWHLLSRRRVRLDHHPVDRLPRPAALLRPRPARRQRQGLTGQPGTGPAP